MNLHAFLTLFYPIFLTSVAVGPVFITISNIAINYGIKNGLFAVIGVVFGNILYMFIGALTARQIINSLPQNLIQIVSLLASLFLLYIAINFFRKDVRKMKDNNVFDFNIKTIFKMFFITLSSPVVIAGYSITFLSVVGVVEKYFWSSIFGGVFAAIIAYSLVAIVFGFISIKIHNFNENTKYKILSILNKIAVTLLSGFALLLIFNFIKETAKRFI